MAIDYASIIRAGAGLLFGVGLVLVLRKPRTTPMLVWGAAYLAYAVTRLYGNVMTLIRGRFTLATPFDQAVFISGTLLAAAAMALLLRGVMARLDARRRRFLSIILAAWLILWIAALFAYPPFATSSRRSIAN